ncbi:MAG: cryptochrome/photolyase family protein [Balneolaceae bacterium]|nr:MAG: cryptochrome/photolyase family protein [Balneolaceae bacterium]
MTTTERSVFDQSLKQSTPEGFEQALLVIHDQLNSGLFPDDVIQNKPLLIFVESYGQSREHPYHKKKLVYQFASQRHFAIECADAGYPVLYLTGDEHYNDRIGQLLREYPDLSITWMQPLEWDTRKRLEAVNADYPDRTRVLANPFFMAKPEEWTDKIRDGYRMEFFYREMRKTTGYLMDEGRPAGGEWNYDKSNREKLPEGHNVPEIAACEPDDITQEVIGWVADSFAGHFGETDGFNLAVTRSEALQLADSFFKERLNEFGPYEDAMARGKPTLFHSVLSVYMNNGLLLPGELCDRAEAAYIEGQAPLNSVEGYIRQIIGWREYIRLYYEAMMPDVRSANAFGFSNKLPRFFWDADTKMNCVSEAVGQVIRNGYSHHIQRLMILSNIGNLTETDPHAIFEWFLYAYVDASEWVVLPNVLGMSTFADGGVLASKPYVSGGNYINKMGDYCKDCSYSISKKEGEGACPFNYLYWNFVDKQRDAFKENGRVSFMVNTWEKFDPAKKEAISKSSDQFINELPRYQ